MIMIKKPGLTVGLIAALAATAIAFYFMRSEPPKEMGATERNTQATQTKKIENPDRVGKTPTSPKPAQTRDLGMGNNELNNMIEEAEQQDFENSLRDPRKIIKINFGHADTHQLSKNFSVDSLPAFLEVLENKDFNGSEMARSLSFVYQIAPKGDNKTVDALLAFVKRPVDWEKWEKDKDQADNIVVSKWLALGTIGFIGGDRAEAILKRAITLDGIKELTKEWLPGMPPEVNNKESVLGNMRGYAAKGLAYSPKPEIQNLIKTEYEREKQILIDAGEIAGAYFYQLCDAMQRVDVVKKIGLDGHAALFDGQDSYSEAYDKYSKNYSLQKHAIRVKKKY